MEAFNFSGLFDNMPPIEIAIPSAETFSPKHNGRDHGIIGIISEEIGKHYFVVLIGAVAAFMGKRLCSRRKLGTDRDHVQDPEAPIGNEDPSDTEDTARLVPESSITRTFEVLKVHRNPVQDSPATEVLSNANDTSKLVPQSFITKTFEIMKIHRNPVQDPSAADDPPNTEDTPGSEDPSDTEDTARLVPQSSITRSFEVPRAHRDPVRDPSTAEDPANTEDTSGIKDTSEIKDTEDTARLVYHQSFNTRTFEILRVDQDQVQDPLEIKDDLRLIHQSSHPATDTPSHITDQIEFHTASHYAFREFHTVVTTADTTRNCTTTV